MNFLRILETYRLPSLDLLFQLVTLSAQEAFVIAIICWLYWCQNKKLAYTLGFTYFSSGLLVQGLKITFRIPRPWIIDPTFSPVQSAVPAATGYSFPSGHTQSGTALFSTLYFSSKKRLIRAFCIFFIIIIGFSRLYLGVHTPKDVLTSAALTLILSLFIWKKQDHLFNNPDLTLLLSVLMGLLCIILLIYTCTLQLCGTIPATEAEDCIKSCGAGLGFAIGHYLEKQLIHFKTGETIPSKILRFFIGITVTLILQQGLKYIMGTSEIADFLRYFIVVIWVIALYPFLFMKHGKTKESHA